MDGKRRRRQLYMSMVLGLLLAAGTMAAGTETAAGSSVAASVKAAASAKAAEVYTQGLEILEGPQIEDDERARFDEFAKERQETAEKEAKLLEEEQREVSMKRREAQYQMRKAFAASLPKNTVLDRLFPDDREELVMQYLQIEAAENQPRDLKEEIAPSRGSRLKGNDRKIYKYVRKEIKKIAAGEREKTEILYAGNLLLGEKTEFTAEDLGLDEIIQYGELTKEAKAAFFDLFDCNFRGILDALVADLPYDLYWYDSVANGCSAGMLTEGFGDANCMTVVFTDEDGEQISRVVRYPVIRFAFSVSSDYRAGDVGGYFVDSGKTGAARSAAERAKIIVAGASKRSDLEKLKAYCQVICGLAEYDNGITKTYVKEGNSDPWQVVNVFDNDPQTRTLCAGYARAFQLLCDLTEFEDPGIKCYTVTGRRDGEWHMWNVVHMDDGKNYLVDVTRCDGSVMMNADGFLRGQENGMDADGYQYDNRTAAMYDIAELQLSRTDYGRKYTDGEVQVSNVTPSVKLAKTRFSWTGKEIHPEITVRAGNAGELTPAEYIVSYDKTPVDVGEYEVRVDLKGRLRGTQTATFRILPPETSFDKLISGSQKFEVRWRKQLNHASGYQIQYSEDPDFEENVKTETISGQDATYRTIHCQTSDAKYYVRIRTVLRDGEGIVGSKWSKGRSVRVN